MNAVKSNLTIPMIKGVHIDQITVWAKRVCISIEVPGIHLLSVYMHNHRRSNLFLRFEQNKDLSFVLFKIERVRMYAQIRRNDIL